MAQEWIDNQREIWRDKIEYWEKNNYYGACNTGSGRAMICVLGGIYCDVDHQFVFIRNVLNGTLNGK